ncbi:MAG TPA: hypothetical protein VFY87_28010 [Geminicoccaceae bacterium]|nr:hypothetical protein [Geminicoccaceae bacterium]
MTYSDINKKQIDEDRPTTIGFQGQLHDTLFRNTSGQSFQSAFKLRALPSLCFFVGRAQAAPDIVVVLIEDMGAAVIGPERRSVSAATLSIDALSAGGTAFTQACAAPACLPARTTLMAGRWPQRNSVGGDNPRGGSRRRDGPIAGTWAWNV